MRDIPLISTVATGWTFTTSIDSGYQMASGTIPLPLDRAITTNIFNASVVIMCNGRVVWEGVVTESGANTSGLAVSALGRFAQFDDKVITSFYGHEGSADWRIVTEDDIALIRSGDAYETDNNNRLYLAPRKGEFLNWTTEVGAFCYQVPNGSSRLLTGISFDYEIVGPAPFVGFVGAYQTGFTGLTLPVTLPAGAGSAFIVLPPNTAIVELGLWFSAGVGVYTGETGDVYARYTNIRVMSGGVASLSSADVVADIVAQTYALNQSINATTAFVQQSGSLAIRSYAPQDVTAKSQIIEMGRRNRWQVTYYDGLRFCPYGAQARVWYVSADTITVQESISELYNRGYGVYSDEGGGTLRTPVADELTSQAMYGVKRELAVSADTTSLATATLYRDTAIADSAFPSPRVTVTIRHEIMPNACEIKAGDKIIVKNVPPSRIIDFIVGDTAYDVDSGIMAISSLDPIATLEALIASRA